MRAAREMVETLAERKMLAIVAAAVVAVLVVAVALGFAGVLRPKTKETLPPPSDSSSGPPSTPTALRCDQVSVAGPSTPPAGAVTVSTDDKLPKVVAAHWEGTTYWLEPGTHHLGKGRYNQVIPQSGDTFIGAPGAILDGGHENAYAFGGHASGVTIQTLTVQNFGGKLENNNEGVVNHDSADGWTVESSMIQHNAGAGVMLGSRNRLIGNCLRNNGQYGFNAYHADDVADIVMDGNEIAGNNTDDWESKQPGCGCTGGGKFWATKGATITGNYVHDNKGVGLWADNNNVGFLFEGNYISGNHAEGLMYETSYNAAILNNTFVRNALVKGPTNPSFPGAALYISESGSDPRVPGPYNDAFRVSGNVFIDNWSGIVAWENADRFSGSAADTSTGSETLVNPSVATVKACGDKANIGKKPYFDDCRWKTQNVLVENNVFRFEPTKIPLCARSMGCGFSGVFSNWGTYPAWSPYKADVVQENITFEQNNVWRSNSYVGDWQFVVKETGTVVGWDVWRSAPYNQDVDSKVS